MRDAESDGRNKDRGIRCEDLNVKRVLGVFAKAPRPGLVKSRLIAVLGAESATRLYDAFLRDFLPRLVQLDATRVLAFASPADREFFSSLCGTQFELEVQTGNDLGARMAAFFRSQFERGSSCVVLVGSDSPDLPLERIECAFDRLGESDVVLGPCDDGGYYLIGMRRLVRDVFTDIAWGTGSVFLQTAARLTETNVRFTVLDPWYDIDRPEDLARLSQHITAAHDAGRDLGLVQTEAVLQELIERTQSLTALCGGISGSTESRDVPHRPR